MTTRRRAACTAGRWTFFRGEFEERTWQAFWRAAVEEQDKAAVAAAPGMAPVAVRIAKSRVLARLREEAGELIG
jgi:RNA polymerase sigma-70 factor (ECF subfamily)